MSGCRDLLASHGLLLRRGLADPEAIVQPAQGGRRPPVPVAGQLHQCGHQRRAHDEGIDQHCHCKAEAEQQAREAKEKRRLAALNPAPPRDSVRFAKSVGKLAWPAQGERVRQFGDKNGFGGTSEGIFIATGKQAQITTPADGFGLDGALRARQDALIGILNGIDTDVWNPASDPHIAANFSARTLADREANRAALLDRIGFPHDNTPIVTIGFCLGARAVYRRMMRDGDRVVAGAGWHPSFLADDGDDSPHLTAGGLAAPR